MSVNQSEIDAAFELGAVAYLEGKPMDSNPCAKELSPELHAAWNQGWRHEKNYYEGKL